MPSALQLAKVFRATSVSREDNEYRLKGEAGCVTHAGRTKEMGCCGGILALTGSHFIDCDKQEIRYLALSV